jgi:hypothetical protein
MKSSHAAKAVYFELDPYIQSLYTRNNTRVVSHDGQIRDEKSIKNKKLYLMMFLIICTSDSTSELTT